MEKLYKFTNEYNEINYIDENNNILLFVPSYALNNFEIIELFDKNDSIILKAYDKLNKNNQYIEARQYLKDTDYIACKLAEGVATKEEYAEQLAKRAEARIIINEFESLMD